ncbi:MAG TPA: YihY/virulence factor BrkB family protein [Kamptonema sp.]|nr:YihY/virulence factor BrkB family protein [Kamptonema sp.]
MNIFHSFRHLIVAVFKILWRLLRRIVRRSRRFFNFFSHLNWTTIREVGDRAGKQRLLGLSAEMAYNAMLALFPALLAFIAAIGLFESLQSTLYQMARLLGEIVPDDVRNLISGLIQQIIQTRNQQIFSVSFLGAIWAFSGVLSAAMAALDQIHQIPPAQTRPFWKAKIVSIILTFGTILLLILACGVVFISDLIVQLLARQSCWLEAVSNCELQNVQNCQLLPIQNCPLESSVLAIWQLWRWPITLGIVSMAFAFIYRYGPSRHHPGTPLLPGAILAAIFWAGISSLLRIYVYHFGNYNWTYGTIGTFILLLLWLNFSSLVMLLGAQLNVTVGKAMKG